MQLSVEDLLRQMPLDERLLVKVLLKFPTVRAPFFIRRLRSVYGFLCVTAQLSLVTVYGFLTLMIFSAATDILGFPLNVLIGLILPVIAFLVFLRFQLIRTINWWNSVFNSSRTWDPKSIDEYIELVMRQRQRRNESR